MAATAPRSTPNVVLTAGTVGLVVVETAMLMAFGPAPNQALGVQVSAPAPFGVFHDLRWLVVYHPSWLAFAGEFAALLVFRTAVDAFLLRAAWPDPTDRPSWRAALCRSAAFTVTTALLLAPWVGLLFGMGLVSLSWLFFAAVPAVVVVSLLVHHGIVSGRWWRDRPTLRTLGWMVATVVVISVGGAAVVEAPTWARLFVAAAIGVFHARAWMGVVGGALRVDGQPRVRRRPSVLVPAALVAFMVVAVSGTAAGVRLGRPTDEPPAVADSTGSVPVLVVKGFGSEWEGDDRPELVAPLAAFRFSYAGLDRSGRARPYAAEATFHSLDRLVAVMDVQVRALARTFDAPVTVVAESEGALVAKAYLLGQPDAPVDALVTVSPLPRPGRVYYPPGGRDDWGVAAALELQGLASAIAGVTPIDLSADDGLLRSMADRGPLLRRILACPLPGVTEIVILPLADAVVSVGVAEGRAPATTVAAFHGGLLGRASVQALVRDAALGRLPAPDTRLATEARIVSALSAAWHVPELAASLVPAWDGSDHPRCD